MNATRRIALAATLLLILPGAVVSLSACATKPVRALPDSAYRQSAGVAYLKKWGHARQPFWSLPDEAFVERIDSTDIPSFRAFGPSPYGLVLEIPAGKHVVYISDKEETAVCLGLGGCIWANHPGRSLELIAEPGRVYVPYAADWCSRKLFWIAEVGAHSPPQEPGKTVAGEAPTAAPCASVSSGTRAPAADDLVNAQ